jgi:hypothetical protein
MKKGILSEKITIPHKKSQEKQQQSAGGMAWHKWKNPCLANKRH